MEELKALSMGYALFLVLIGIEVAWSLHCKDGTYRWNQLIANVGHGMVFQVMELSTKAVLMLPYFMLSEYAWTQLPLDTVWSWLVGLLSFEFCIYWKHRHHHEVRFLWAVHGVHHAAEDYNFAAALRQGVGQSILGWMWVLPLALFMPLKMFMGLVAFNYLYQFGLHTRYAPKLGPIEWVMNTPSHHRVHHGTEEHYLDKNYGGILIIWDRLFGTFQAEEEEPTYGMTKPIGTSDPVWGNVALFADLLQAARRTASWRDTVALFLRGPGAEADLAPGGRIRPRDSFVNSETPAGLSRYVLATFFTGPALLLALVWTPPVESSLRTILGAVVILGTMTAPALLHQQAWAKPAEGARLSAIALLLVMWPLPQLTEGALAAALLVAALAAVTLQLGSTTSGPRVDPLR